VEVNSNRCCCTEVKSSQLGFFSRSVGRLVSWLGLTSPNVVKAAAASAAAAAVIDWKRLDLIFFFVAFRAVLGFGCSST
jgi:hypothetical protein